MFGQTASGGLPSDIAKRGDWEGRSGLTSSLTKFVPMTASTARSGKQPKKRLSEKNMFRREKSWKKWDAFSKKELPPLIISHSVVQGNQPSIPKSDRSSKALKRL